MTNRSNSAEYITTAIYARRGNWHQKWVKKMHQWRMGWDEKKMERFARLKKSFQTSHCTTPKHVESFQGQTLSWVESYSKAANIQIIWPKPLYTTLHVFSFQTSWAWNWYSLVSLLLLPHRGQRMVRWTYWKLKEIGISWLSSSNSRNSRARRGH